MDGHDAYDDEERPDADPVRQETLYRQIEDIIAGAGDPDAAEDALEQVCTLLLDEAPAYNWVGFYYVDPERPRELTLGPYAGEPLERTHIPFGRGVCGRAAEADDVFVNPETLTTPSAEVAHPDMRAEIAVPVKDDDTVVGVLNVDSTRPAVFDENDRTFLRRVGELTGPLVSRWVRQP